MLSGHLGQQVGGLTSLIRPVSRRVIVQYSECNRDLAISSSRKPAENAPRSQPTTEPTTTDKTPLRYLLLEGFRIEVEVPSRLTPLIPHWACRESESKS